MYYVMIAEQRTPAVARSIGRAETSSAARRLAVSLDLALHGRPTGRLFYLDQESFIDWCTRGKAVGAAPGGLVDATEPEPKAPAPAPSGHPAIRSAA